MPTSPYFKGDATRSIEEEWWLPVMSQLVSNLLKTKVISAMPIPMEQPLYAITLDAPVSQEEACMRRAFEMVAKKDATATATEESPISLPA